MVSLTDLFENISSQYKSEQSTGNTPQKLPENGFLLSFIKRFELSLCERGLLPPLRGNSFNPIWFLAEMERNIYLWRRGLSIDNATDYLFWLDIRSLVTKRLNLLEQNNKDNPFLNPLWGMGDVGSGFDSEVSDSERSYLQRFLEVYHHAEVHLNALSMVQILIDHRCSKELVTIPANFKHH